VIEAGTGQEADKEPGAVLHSLEAGFHQRGHLGDGVRSPSGLPVQPWIFDAYAPAGAVISTTHDLSILATALLDGTAPAWTR
jgi:hypothetical protein